MIDLIKQTNVIPRSPTTELRLYCGVPWDDNYRHVRLFNNTQDLLNNLDNWRVYPSNSERLMEMSPIKVGSLTLRVPFAEMEALELNYLAFCNHGISEKWVFCFINSIEWLSENSTRINFSLDIFQNNFYNVRIKPCFVEMQHIYRSDDVFGGNLLPVNIETGEPIVSYRNHYAFSDWYVSLYVTETPVVSSKGKKDWVNANGTLDGNIYSPLAVVSIIADDEYIGTIREFISAYQDDNKLDSIVAIVMTPKICSDNEDFERDVANIENLFEGYTPKNKKLYSYPFCYILADNNSGTTETLYFEDTESGTLTVRIQGTYNTLPQVMTTPRNYKKTLNYWAASIINSNFPLCSWQSDTFRAWIAQNKSTLALTATQATWNTYKAGANAVASTLSGASKLATANITGGISETTAGVSNFIDALFDEGRLIAEIQDKERAPITAKGKALSENITTATGVNGLTFYTMSCRRQFAEIADSYFEQFGYPIRKITTPLLNSRSSWNYIKTVGCNFTGCIDLNQLKMLRAIFDNGVTLWHTNDIGNYSLENN